MRTAFIDALTAEARRNQDLFLLTADLGFTVLERFRDAWSIAHRAIPITASRTSA